jgi:hypothetical protein
MPKHVYQPCDIFIGLNFKESRQITIELVLTVTYSRITLQLLINITSTTICFLLKKLKKVVFIDNRLVALSVDVLSSLVKCQSQICGNLIFGLFAAGINTITMDNLEANIMDKSMRSVFGKLFFKYF